MLYMVKHWLRRHKAAKLVKEMSPIESTIGYVMVEMGFITRYQLVDAVTAQRLMLPARYLLGDIMLDGGFVTVTQLEQAIVRQKEKRGQDPEYVKAAAHMVDTLIAQAVSTLPTLDRLNTTVEKLRQSRKESDGPVHQ